MKFSSILIKRTIVFLIVILCSFLQTTLLRAMLNDEIDFFNVGQGHAVLINKVGAKTPLLIDAGSMDHPSKIGTRYDWASQDKVSLTSQISERILEIWKASNGGTLFKKQLYLNVIITHPDKDHKDFVPLILTQLEKKASGRKASFFPHFLLGGKPSLYPDFIAQYKNKIIYSKNFSGLHSEGNLNFLDTSNCITHLFCPQGPSGNTSTDRNRWSIITRIQINGISALFTGDADDVVKGQMLHSLGDKSNGLETDILLTPHHGAAGIYHAEWDQLVNPKTIIIGAALKHNHPKGSTLLEFLKLKKGKGRIWNDRVMPHGLQYYCKDPIQQEIVSLFSQRESQRDNRLFDHVPNSPIEDQPLGEQWYLAWVDLPIYTLWTTGTLRFEKELLEPKFIDAPHGLMGYIAVSDPKYLLSPYIRGTLTSLIPLERESHDTIARLVKKQNTNKNEGDEYINMVLKESLLIADHQDRAHYHNTLLRIFLTIKPRLSWNIDCFPELRKVIVERNKKVEHSKERVLQAGNFLFRDFDSLVKTPDSDFLSDLCDGAFSQNVLVFKTFLKSVHNITKLKKYVKLASNITRCGPSVDEIDEICPFGYPEWLQLAKLVEFFREEILAPNPEGISIGDVIGIVPLRNQGMNFKEIAKFMIEEEGFIDIYLDDVRAYKGDKTFARTKNELYQRLELYFPSVLDEFLS